MNETAKLEELLAKQVAIASELRGLKSNFLGVGQDVWFERFESAEDAADEAAAEIRSALELAKRTL